MYVEASGRREGDKAWLLSDVLPYNDIKCLAFWYFMRGSDLGKLNVYRLRAQTKELVWTVEGKYIYLKLKLRCHKIS